MRRVQGLFSLRLMCLLYLNLPRRLVRRLKEERMRGMVKILVEIQAGVEQMALALQASLLLRSAPSPIADAFIASRLEGRALTFGALPPALDLEPILERQAAFQ